MHLHTCSFAVAMLAVSACASSGIGSHRALATPNEVVAPRDSALAGNLAEVPAIVHVVNGTAQAYRVSIVVGGYARVLGTVSGQETRDFAIARKSIVGYEEFELIAAVRDGGEHRNSERFSLSGARVVEWVLDSRLSRSVTLR